MTAIFARLKRDGLFGFSTNSASMQDCLYGITYAELESKVGPGTSWGIANGDISVAPGSPAGEVIRTCIEQVKAWYDAGYWYPGEGAVNTTPDDANAGFAQGKCIFIFNFSGSLDTLRNLSNFEIGTFMKPTSKAGMKSYENIEPDIYFIPSNASKEQITAAIEFLKICLSEEVQQAQVASLFIPAILSFTYTNVDPTFQSVMDKLAGGTILAGINPTRTSSEMQTFIKTQIFAAPLSGIMTIDQTLNEMERIRLAARAAK
jgi:ABC-type glycerol-3-phosphate transport system substrate-binding protein